MESSNAARCNPMARAAVMARISAIIFRNAFNPSPSGVKRYSFGIKTSLKATSQMGVVRVPKQSNSRADRNPGKCTRHKEISYPAQPFLRIGLTHDRIKTGFRPVSDPSLHAVYQIPVVDFGGPCGNSRPNRNPHRARSYKNSLFSHPALPVRSIASRISSVP